MLKSTFQLLEYLKLDKSAIESTIVSSLVNSILKCGDKNDADALITPYLQNQFKDYTSYLLPIFEKFGDGATAEQLFNESFSQGVLKENAGEQILRVLGALKYEPIKPILANYVFNGVENDYYISLNASLGLLHFDCEEYQHEIKTAIEKCYGKNLFPEFVPALVCKLKDRKSTLEKLYELGNEFASTDCIAGIILGFSLCEEQGKEYFKKALFNRNWETYYSASGTVYYTLEGLVNLNITFEELYAEIKTISNKEDLTYYLIVFLALLELRVYDFESNYPETFSAIYLTLFKWKNETKSDNFIDLAETVGKGGTAHELKKLIELRMQEEAILQNYLN